METAIRIFFVNNTILLGWFLQFLWCFVWLSWMNVNLLCIFFFYNNTYFVQWVLTFFFCLFVCFLHCRLPWTLNNSRTALPIEQLSFSYVKKSSALRARILPFSARSCCLCPCVTITAACFRPRQFTFIMYTTEQQILRVYNSYSAVCRLIVCSWFCLSYEGSSKVLTLPKLLLSCYIILCKLALDDDPREGLYPVVV